MKHQYFVEMTDTFGREANYSWVNRFLVTSTSELGAIRKVTKHTGYHARKVSDGQYRVPGACMVYFLNDAQGNEAEQYLHVTTL